MSPNEAAGLLGVSPFATPADVHRSYAARLAEAGPDVERRDALTAARDALLAASAWQTPGPVQQQQPPYPAAVIPTPWYPPMPARRGMSTGAIVGITLGSIAAAVVFLLVALFAVAAIGQGSYRLAQGGSGSSAAPSDVPSAPPSVGSSGGSSSGSPSTPPVADYDVDGVHVHYVDGWTFELTSGQTCAGATVTVGFSDTADGNVVSEWSTTLDLKASEPYTLNVPDSASDHLYAGIDAITCGQA